MSLSAYLESIGAEQTVSRPHCGVPSPATANCPQSTAHTPSQEKASLGTLTFIQ